MTHTPPYEAFAPAASPTFPCGQHPLVRLRREDASLCFAIEDAPPTAGTAMPDGGAVRIEQYIEGRVVSAAADRLDLVNEMGIARIRHLLPDGMGFRSLIGRHVHFRLTHRYAPDRTTVDARIRDDMDGHPGRLLFWGRDGTLPDASFSTDVVASELCWRLHGTPTVRLTAGEFRSVELTGAPWTVAALRVAQDDAAFLAVRSAA